MRPLKTRQAEFCHASWGPNFGDETPGFCHIAMSQVLSVSSPCDILMFQNESTFGRNVRLSAFQKFTLRFQLSKSTSNKWRAPLSRLGSAPPQRFLATWNSHAEALSSRRETTNETNCTNKNVGSEAGGQCRKNLSPNALAWGSAPRRQKLGGTAGLPSSVFSAKQINTVAWANVEYITPRGVRLRVHGPCVWGERVE